MTQPGPKQALPPVYIAIPAVEWMWTRTVISLLGLEGLRNCRISFKCGGGGIAHKRNSLVRGFLAESRIDHLLFLDSDMVFPSDLVQRLLAAQKDVVGILYTQRQLPFRLIGGPEWPDADLGASSGIVYSSFEPQTGLQRAGWLGGGALLICRRVLETMPQPWFSDELTPGTNSEDMYFCRKAQQCGFELWCDTDADVGHMDGHSVTARTAPRWREAVG